MQFQKIKKKKEHPSSQKKKKKKQKTKPQTNPQNNNKTKPPKKTKAKSICVSMKGFLLVSLGGFVVVGGLICLNLTNIVQRTQWIIWQRLTQRKSKQSHCSFMPVTWTRPGKPQELTWTGMDSSWQLAPLWPETPQVSSGYWEHWLSQTGWREHGTWEQQDLPKTTTEQRGFQPCT